MDKIGCERNKPEILAPVGGKEQLLAAVRCGADAVYFGLQNFNARRNADNFAGDDLRRTIEYCHEREVRVFITINTIIKDRELSDMKKAVDTACSAGADGLIVQDLAVWAYARERWPQVPLVASTQMAVHNAEGTMLLKEMGFARAVLARELTLDEIRDIYEQTGMSLESFVHGAHCMSVSGLCYLSSMIGGRSGNRGLCAQPCRLDCQLCGRDHALSLKDLSYITHIKELTDAGVRSLKIEGRMKRPEYVAASVLACRAAINGGEPDLETLRSVFSRSGFSDGYLTGKRDVNMFGYRTKDDVTAAADVLEGLAKSYEKEPQIIPVDMYLYVKEGEASRLTVRCSMQKKAGHGALSAEVCGAVPQTAKTLPVTEEYARRSLGKTGGTPYYLRELKLFSDDGLMLPASALNELRRTALEKLAAARVAEFENRNEKASDSIRARKAGLEILSGDHVSGSRSRQHDPEFIARFAHVDQIFDGCPKTVILPLKELAEGMGSRFDKAFGQVDQRLSGPAVIDYIRSFGAEKVIAEIPSVVWPSHMDAVRRQLLKIRELNIKEVYVENLGSLALAGEFGFAAHGGMFLNILNSEALLEYSRLGLTDACLSFEMSFSDMRKIKSCIPLGAVVYGRLPLMKFRNCPARGKNGCGDCSGLNTLTDRKNMRFPVVCQERQYSELLNCVPLYAADKDVPDMDFGILYFTTESSAECAEITGLACAGDAFPYNKTAGLYFRELL